MTSSSNSNTTPSSTRENKLTTFNVDLGLSPSSSDDKNQSPLLAAQGEFQMWCIDEADARIVVDEVFDDALNGYFGKGGLVVPTEEDALIVDAGANIGAFSVFMKRILPNCRIHAFEPVRLFL